jgi:hypothetical protein
LKRLISDKEIQRNPSLFLGKIWLELGLAWPDLEKFGSGLETVFYNTWYVCNSAILMVKRHAACYHPAAK